MALFKLAILVPSFTVGAWFIHQGPPPGSAPLAPITGVALAPRTPAALSGDKAVASVPTEAKAKSSKRADSTQESILRRVRVERILVTLDHVAAVAVQMNPDHADRIEPVINDLAEQSLELASEEAVSTSASDEDLERIEKTIDGLVTALDRMVEPELSL